MPRTLSAGATVRAWYVNAKCQGQKCCVRSISFLALDIRGIALDKRPCDWHC